MLIDPILERVKKAAATDPVTKELKSTIINGFLNDKCNLYQALPPFWNARHQLAIDETNDMFLVDTRLVISKKLRKAII